MVDNSNAGRKEGDDVIAVDAPSSRKCQFDRRSASKLVISMRTLHNKPMRPEATVLWQELRTGVADFEEHRSAILAVHSKQHGSRAK